MPNTESPFESFPESPLGLPAKSVGSVLSVAERVFVALDVPDAEQALVLAEALAPLGVSFKVGMQLFYAEGVTVLQRLSALERPIFVDLKLHDIPNTVAGAVDSLVRQGVSFLNVHAPGGVEMMRAAAEAGRKAALAVGRPVPKIIAVTLLTSLSEQQLRDELRVNDVPVSDYVRHLALQTQSAGLDGVVCSAQEAAAIRQACGPDFLLVTPGIRPTQAGVQDQARIVTPAQALKNGSDYLVVGRPITGAASPVAAAQAIISEMQEALAHG